MVRMEPVLTQRKLKHRSRKLKGHLATVSARSATVLEEMMDHLGANIPDDDGEEEEMAVRLATAVGLYQKKERRCFGCGSLDHLVADCPQKKALNPQEGSVKKAWASPSSVPKLLSVPSGTHIV